MTRQGENDPRNNASVHEMSLLVGTLTGELRGVKESVEHLNRLWGEREQAATEGRRVIHEKIGTMQHDLQRVEAVVENVARDMADTIRPAIESYRTDRDREDGAKKQNKKIYGAFTLLAGLGGGGLAELLHRWIH